MVAGEVYIGGGESDAIRLIAQTARELQVQCPNVRYHMFSGNAEDVGERLDKGLLDFGVLVGPGDLKKYAYIRLPVTDIWGVLMRKDSPLAEKEAVLPEDLWDKPLMFSRQSLWKDQLFEWFRREYDALNVVATYNLIFNASLMVEEGMGYAMCLDKLVNTAGDSNLCFRPMEPQIELELYVVWKKFQVFSKAAERFLSILQKKVVQA